MGATLLPPGAGAPAPADPLEWLRTMHPAHVRAPFAPRHEELWEWVAGICRGVRPRPFIGIWPRHGGKSTSAELAAEYLGLHGLRGYVLYLRGTQDDADKSVQNIAALLESQSVERHYPRHAQRAVGKYGNSKGWRRERLVTAGGLVVDAAGLDTAIRGLKFEERRPDVIIFDDLDALHDSADATRKKIGTLKKSVLPAGSDDCAILGIQNLIIPNGIFAQLADGRADFLANRIVSGPHPAVVGLVTETRWSEDLNRNRAVIVGGSPTWEGQDLEKCQEQVDTFGLTTFIEECQHEVHEREGALWTKDGINATRVQELPDLKRVVVGVDPSGGGDAIGVIGAGIGTDGHLYVWRDRTQAGKLGPLNWGRAAVSLYDDEHGDRIVAEKNFGGDMVASNIKVAARDDDGSERHVPVAMVNASRGKAVRAEPVASLWEDGVAHIVGSLPELEAEMTGWVPGDKNSPNRLDAMVWAATDLMLTRKRKVGVYFPGMEEAEA